MEPAKGTSQRGRSLIESRARLDRLLQKRVRVRYARRHVDELLPALELVVKGEAVKLLFPIVRVRIGVVRRPGLVTNGLDLAVVVLWLLNRCRRCADDRLALNQTVADI